MSCLVFGLCSYCTGFSGAPGYALGYGAGFFSSIDGVAYASDAFLDLIPVDTVSSLILAAAAAAAAGGAAYPGDAAKVYHAASADSFPLSIVKAYENLHKAWTGNACPARLPFAR